MSQHPEESDFEARWDKENDALLNEGVEIPDIDKDERFEARLATGLILGAVAAGGVYLWKKHKKE